MYTMEYYIVFKNKEVLPHATTWMNLEDIKPSEICHIQKDKFPMIPFVSGYHNSLTVV